MKTIIVTHNDLDGYGCGIILSKLEDDTYKTYHCGYGEVDKILLEQEHPARFLISDICPSADTLLRVLEEGSEVVIIDHHATSLWVKDVDHPKLTAVVDITKSATKLCWLYVQQQGVNVLRYHKFVEAVNSHDLWLGDNPDSKVLEFLFKGMSRSDFEARFLSNFSLELSEEERIIVRLKEEEESQAIMQALLSAAKGVDADLHTFSIVLVNNFINEIAETLLDKGGSDYIILVNPFIRPNPNTKLGVVSLRSRGDMDVSTIAHKFKGGGHKNAAGFFLQNWDTSFFGVDPRINM